MGEVTGRADLNGWGESSVDEMVAKLEAVYADRTEASRRGAAGRGVHGRLGLAGADRPASGRGRGAQLVVLLDRPYLAVQAACRAAVNSAAMRLPSQTGDAGQVRARKPAR